MSSSAKNLLPFPQRQGEPQSPLAWKPTEKIESGSIGSSAPASPPGESIFPPASHPGADALQRAFAELRASLGTAQRIAESLEARESLEHALEVRAGRRAALEAAWREVSVPGWDGYGAEAVTASTYAMAKAFLETLPTDAPTPEIRADPDGEISFDWYTRPDQVFSVSVGGSGMLSYAGLFGKNNAEGKEWYDGGLPEVVAFNLARLYRNK